MPPRGDDVGQVGAGVEKKVIPPFLKGDVQRVIFDIYPGNIIKKGLIVMNCVFLSGRRCRLVRNVQRQCGAAVARI